MKKSNEKKQIYYDGPSKSEEGHEDMMIWVIAQRNSYQNAKRNRAL